MPCSAQTVLMARTILDYEARSDRVEKQAAAAFVANEAADCTRLPWTLLMKLGVLPRIHAPSEGSKTTKEPPFGSKDEHPVALAAAFRDDPVVVRHFMEVIETSYDYYKRNLFNTSLHGSTARCGYQHHHYVPPPLEGAPLRGAHNQVFQPSHVTWYRDAAASQGIEFCCAGYASAHAIFEATQGALVLASQDSTKLRSLALRQLHKELAKTGRKRYEELCSLIAFCDQDEVETFLLSQKDGSIRSLLLALENPSSKAMVAGLKAAAGQSKPLTLVHLRRSPTFEELATSNVKGAAELWFRMPWAVLEPTVLGSGDKMRSLLMKHFDDDSNPDRIAKCFINHPGRWKSYTSIAANKMEEYKLVWERYVNSLRSRYYAALELRNVFRLEGIPEEVQQVLMIAKLTENADLYRHMVEALTDPVVLALNAYTTPLVAEKWRLGTRAPTFTEEA